MNEKTEPKIRENADNVDDFISSFMPENSSKRGGDADIDSIDRDTIRPGNSPTFYTVLVFHRAFCDYAFNDYLAFMLRNNPYFGAGTFGHLSRFMLQRAFVISKQLPELEDGG